MVTLVVNNWFEHFACLSTMKIGTTHKRRVGRVLSFQSVQLAVQMLVQEDGMPVTNQCRCVFGVKHECNLADLQCFLLCT